MTPKQIFLPDRVSANLTDFIRLSHIPFPLDIRTLYVQFILSFVDQETSTVVKSAFLEQHRDVFLSIFKGIVQDPYLIIHKIFEVCWTGIWSDQKIKRTLKIGLFNESTIFQVCQRYNNTVTL